MLGFNAPSSRVSYAYAANNNGQNFASGSLDRLVFDTIVHVSPGFTAVAASDHINYNAGIYLAVGDIYTASDPLTTGELHCGIGGLDSGVAFISPIVAALTSLGGANCIKFIVSPNGGTMWVAGGHSDTDVASLGGDLLIIRLGSV